MLQGAPAPAPAPAHYEPATRVSPLMNDAIQKAVRLLDNAVQYDGETVKVTRPAALQTEAMDRLVRLAVFGKTDDEREAARWLIWELGQEVGCRPASIHDLYMARGR